MAGETVERVIPHHSGAIETHAEQGAQPGNKVDPGTGQLIAPGPVTEGDDHHRQAHGTDHGPFHRHVIVVEQADHQRGNGRIQAQLEHLVQVGGAVAGIQEFPRHHGAEDPAQLDVDVQVFLVEPGLEPAEDLHAMHLLGHHEQHGEQDVGGVVDVTGFAHHQGDEEVVGEQGEERAHEQPLDPLVHRYLAQVAVQLPEVQRQAHGIAGLDAQVQSVAFPGRQVQTEGGVGHLEFTLGPLIRIAVLLPRHHLVLFIDQVQVRLVHQRQHQLNHPVGHRVVAIAVDHVALDPENRLGIAVVEHPHGVLTERRRIAGDHILQAVFVGLVLKIVEAAADVVMRFPVADLYRTIQTAPGFLGTGPGHQNRAEHRQNKEQPGIPGMCGQSGVQNCDLSGRGESNGALCCKHAFTGTVWSLEWIDENALVFQGVYRVSGRCAERRAHGL